MIRSFSLFFFSLPFLFGLLRAAATGNDFRYLWVAAASFVGAGAITVAMKASSRERRLAISIGTFIVATLCAIAAGMLLETRFGIGLLVVASSFGFCSAVGWTLFALIPNS